MERKLRVVAYPLGSARYVPSVRIAGHWLRELGFDFGDRVKVKASPGKIEITKERGSNG